MSKEELGQEFEKRFSCQPSYFFYCPGRVNLIGEHIDYNGGKVMPCAIARGTWLAVSKNKDMRFRFHCLNFPETADLKLQSSYSKSGKTWYNYPLGVINEFLEDGIGLSGLDMLFSGDIPIGAGLSSSASIEVVTGYALDQIFNAGISRTDIALKSKNAENNFVGVNCGIMDQFAVAMGKKDAAILLDCDNLDYEYLPFATGNYELVVINTNKHRTLADSKYNERFAECGAALKALKKELKVDNLCDVTMVQFENKRDLIKDPVLQKRAMHVISEYARVKDATLALQVKDMETFGKLMYQSHHSLRYDYEVSCAELDTIVDYSTEFRGCAGARMTGAGFGGCAIALIEHSRLEEYRKGLEKHYREQVGYNCEIFSTRAEDGVESK